MDSIPSRSSPKQRLAVDTISPKTTAPTSLNVAHPAFSDQRELSLFHELPFEIRTMIYRLLIIDLGQLLHIDSQHAHYKYYERQEFRMCQPCSLLDHTRSEDELQEYKGPASSWGSTHYECSRVAQESRQAAPEVRNFFALAFSCRQM